MTEYPPLFILRHGQTEWNLAHRIQGALDSPLTQLGEAQAQTQTRLLTQILDQYACEAVVSPLGRTRQTAEIALAGHKLTAPIRFDARIAEITAGEWQGLERSEIARKWPQEAQASNDFEYYTQSVGGEGATALRARCEVFLSEITKPTILVTHGICSVMLRGLACGLDHKGMCQLPLTQGCIFVIEDGREEILQETK